MYLLDAADEHIPQLKDELKLLGDSLVVVGGDGFGTSTSTSTMRVPPSRRPWHSGARTGSASRIW